MQDQSETWTAGTTDNRELSTEDPSRMSTDESISLGPPNVISGVLSSEDVLAWFRPKSDLSYRTISDLTVADKDLYQSLLTGAMMKDCSFVRVRFSRCDLDGMRIERSTFHECDFTSCDIRSSHFIECQFESCSFDEALVHECEFVTSKLSNSSFKSASFMRGRIYRSTLANCQLSRGTFLHNRLYQTEISQTVLGDCTFLYSIFRDCTLRDVTINAESVGTIFGISLEQLRSVSLIYLGQDQPIPYGADILTLLSGEYARRHWDIGLLVLSLNYNLVSAIAAVEIYLVKSHKRFREVGFIKEEELQFLGDILQELASLGKVPLLALFDVLEWCTALEAIAYLDLLGDQDANVEPIRTLAGRVGLIVNGQLERFDDEVSSLWDLSDKAIWRFSITFGAKPAISSIDLLNDLVASSGYGEFGMPAYFIESRLGSYIEILGAGVISIYAFQVFLFLLNGCIIQITELKHRMKVLTQASSAKQYASMALSPKQSASPALISILPSLLKYAKGLAWSSQPSLAGFATTNIESLNLDGKISE